MSIINALIIIIIIIIIITMFIKGMACFLFLNPQDEVGPSISSWVVLCSFVLLIDIVVLVLVVCLCPSSVHVVATFPGTVLFPLLCYTCFLFLHPQDEVGPSISSWVVLCSSVLLVYIVVIVLVVCLCLILKMKSVPPSLPRSSYVPSSFWFIL